MKTNYFSDGSIDPRWFADEWLRQHGQSQCVIIIDACIPDGISEEIYTSNPEAVTYFLAVPPVCTIKILLGPKLTGINMI
jgi:hypothetical protein